MKNLMKQITTSLSLTLMAVSLVVINPDLAQAKGKKRAGNSAKVKSHAKSYHLENAWVPKSHAKRLSASNSNGWATFPSSSHSRSASEFTSQTLPHSDGLTISKTKPGSDSAVRRKNGAGAEGFSIDIGTSENIRSNTEGARRKATKRARK